MEKTNLIELARYYGRSFDRVLIPDRDRFYSLSYDTETGDCNVVECIPFDGLENTVRNYHLQGLSVRAVIGVDKYGNYTSPNTTEMEYWQEEDY